MTAKQKTLVTIKIRQNDEKLFDFLKDYHGYDHSVVYTLDRHAGIYIHVVYYYNARLNFFDKRKIRCSVKRRDGGIIDIQTLSPKPPLLSAEDKKRLVNSAIVSASAFVAGLAGIKSLTTLEWIHSAVLAVIPAASAFLSRLAVERGISTKSSEVPGNDEE